MTAALFNHLWQSTVFAAGVALLSLAFRHNRARLRYGLWFAASMKFLIPFAALAAIGGLVEWKQAPGAIASVITAPAVRGVQEPFADLWAWAASSNGTVAVMSRPDWIAALAAGVWMCGVAAIAFNRVMEWREMRAAIAASTPWAGSTSSRGVPIRLVASVMEPGVVGFWRPAILLPSGIDTYLTAQQLQAVIAHEVCHARRRDNLTAAVHMVVETACWFHPLVWWIGARLVAEREQACDEHVVETAEPIVYAEGIVSVCRRYLQSPVLRAGVAGADVRTRIEAILSHRIGTRLTPARWMVLTTIAAVSLLMPMVTGAITAAQLPGGAPAGPPVDPEARFEVVSIKPFDASGGAQMRMSMTPGRYEVVGLPVRVVISQALMMPINRLLGGPEWVDTERYAITAKAADGRPAAGPTILVMAANMLKDRFKLATHRETRQLPVYNLVFARGDKRPGPGFRESSPDCQAKIASRIQAAQGMPVAGCESLQINPGTLEFKGVPIVVFAGALVPAVGRTVIDKTGIMSGYYDVTLKWTPEVGGGSLLPFNGAFGPSAAAAPQAPADRDAPSLFTAIQEQLGLKLEDARGPVEVIVIDRVEKPTVD
ncbi:MAG TPA: M56 family metallopeptidase [Vicinamibacterales bacterium]|nr:M56 family metallopeptidase [Vicinamibacterales bacterium]